MVCTFSRIFKILISTTCQGIETSKRQIIKFGARLADGEWHRLGISVKGNSITAIVDCKKQQNREIARYDFSNL
jgi:collagen type V/XI/XXIV/XXVII alpha